MGSDGNDWLSRNSTLKHSIVSIVSDPFPDQYPVTNFIIEGLSRPGPVFAQEHYTERFAQAAINLLLVDKAPFVVGGTGNYFSNEIVLKIVRVAAGNKINKIYTSCSAVISRAAMSYLAVKWKCWGFLVHNSPCHRLAYSKDGNYSIDIIAPDGGSIDSELLDEVFAETQKIGRYRTVPTIESLDLSRCSDMLFNVETSCFIVGVVDSVREYAKLLEGVFNFNRINGLLLGTNNNRPFRIRIDCNNGAIGPYAKYVFEKELGAGGGSIINWTPDNQEKVFDVARVKSMESYKEMCGIGDLGASFDSDGGRCMIFGRRGFLIPSGETVAVITSHFHAIPDFLAHKFGGVGRSFYASSSLDAVIDEDSQELLKTPGSWNYFSYALNRREIILCEDDHFGVGSRHVGARDGIWTILAWLSLVAHHHKPVRDIVTDLWSRFGRNVVRTFEFHDLMPETINGIFSEMSATFQKGELHSSVHVVGGNTYTILHTELIDFPYTSNREINGEKPLQVFLEPQGRIVFRPVIVDDKGVIQIIVEAKTVYEPKNPEKASITCSLFQVALQLSNIVAATGKNEADLTF